VRRQWVDAAGALLSAGDLDPMIARRLEATQWWAAVGTVSLAPLAFSTWTFDVFSLVEATLLWLGASLVIGAALARWAIGGRPLVLPSIAPYVAALLAALGLATVFSRAPVVSALGNYGRLGGLATTVPVVVIAWALAVGAAGRPDRQRALLVTLALSGAVGAAYLWTQQLDLDFADWVDSSSRDPSHPPGTLGNANFSGAHVAIGAVAALAAVRLHQRRAQYLLAALAGFALAGVAVSQSRGAMVAAVVGLTVLALAGKTRWRSIVALVGMAAGMIVLAGLLLVPDGDFGDLFDDSTGHDRLDLWGTALEGWTERPIVGGGPDLYRLTFADNRNDSFGGSSADEPHNVLLDHLDGAGLLGAIAWLGVAGSVARLALIRRRSAGPELNAFSALGAAYLGQALVSIDVVGLQLLGWTAAAGVVAITDRKLTRPVADPSEVTGRARVKLICVALVTLVGISVAVRPALADHHLRRGIEARQRGALDEAVDHHEAAVGWYGWESTYHRQLGLSLLMAASVAPQSDPERQDLAARAAHHLEVALDRFPGDTVARDALASLGALGFATPTGD
jgi:O-antigen ligase